MRGEPTLADHRDTTPSDPGPLALDVSCVGAGPRVVLVHGSVVGADRTWRHQLRLAERWKLCLVNRPGFAGSPPLPRGDFEAEAPLVARELGYGAHLVGHSYGAVIALYAAAIRPKAVRSLTLSEPGCLRVAAGDASVDAMLASGTELYRRASETAPREFLLSFRAGAGSAHDTPEQLDGELLHGVRLLQRERPPWDGDPPLAALAAAPFPKLVISGGHSRAFEAVCDAVAARLSARRVVIEGRGHTIPSTGDAYNTCLEEFLKVAERGRRGRGAPFA